MKLIKGINVSNVLLFLTGISVAFNTLVIGSSAISYVLLFTTLYTLSVLPKLKINTLRRRYGTDIFGLLFFFIYLCAINIIASVLYPQTQEVPIINSSIFLNVLLFYSILSHSLVDELAPKYALYGFVFGAILLAVLFLKGDYAELDLVSNRITIFGLNPNDLGIYMAVSSIVLYSEVILKDTFRLGIFRFLAILPIILMVPIMFATGSRTAFLILVIALVVSVFLYKSRSSLFKYAFIFISVIFAFFAYEYIMNSDLLVVERLLDDSDDSRTSGRSAIWEALLPYIMSNPIFGYGELGYYEVSNLALSSIPGHNYGAGYSPHNVIVEVAIYTGVIGLYFMIRFWRKIAVNAWQICRTLKDITPLLLLIPTFFALISGQLLAPRHYYIIYLVALIPYQRNTNKY